MAASREALVIATGTYEDPDLRLLRSPGQDAEALAEVLRDPAIGDFQVRKVLDEPARSVSLAAQQLFFLIVA
jgi:hypothetical protein